MKAQPSRATIWWLNPFWILVIPLVLIAFVTWLIPEADYQLYWRLPKFFTSEDLALCLWVALAFSIGCLLAVFLDRGLVRTPCVETSASPNWTMLTRLFYGGLVVTVFAYTVWFGAILKQTGLGIIPAVLRGDSGAIYELIRLRKDAAITGVTSLTQVGIGVGLSGVFLGCQLGWKKVRRPLGLLFFVTLLRAVFLAERLALIELMLPGVVLWFQLRGLRGGHVRHLVNFAPFIGVLGLYSLFTFSEYFRSWGYYSEQGETSLLWFTLVRLSGYYVTSLNNGALLWHELGDLGFPYTTLDWIWKFPVIGGMVRDSLGGSDAPAALASIVVAEDSNPEFNNPTGVFTTFTDYGVSGGLVFWVFYGCVLMVLYRAFQRGSIAGLMLYPFAFMALTDQIRLFYLTSGRTFAAWAFLFAAIVVIRREIKDARRMKRHAARR
ncbi:MAG TPA: hypothetical protein PLB55_15525 [Prosthecobacter sp.]|jgi:hypothetical protein|nr:hypothetical protein [Prosthecobacter sp.]